MSHNAAARSAGQEPGAGRYRRHRPEQTLLYWIIEQHYPPFTTHMAGQGRPLPDYVQREFEDYLLAAAWSTAFYGCAATRIGSKPRVNLTRFHGVFAPNSRHSALVTPAKRGKGNKAETPNEPEDPTPAERRAAMTWAQRLKRVFNIDIETRWECGGTVKVIACIEDPVGIEKILTHSQHKLWIDSRGRVSACPMAGIGRGLREGGDGKGRMSPGDSEFRHDFVPP